MTRLIELSYQTVHYRVGSLEITEAKQITKQIVHYRVGSLEIMWTVPGIIR